MTVKPSPRVLVLLFGGLLFTSAVLLVRVAKERVALVLVAPQTGGRASQSQSLQHKDSEYLMSSPTTYFRDNLVEGVKYVTAWPIEGFTNQFMSQINLIYLSELADRVPVLPSFIPSSHMAKDPDPGRLPFSNIYDLPKLQGVVRRPILEWRDVKNTSSREVEEIGCWSIFGTLFNSQPHFKSEDYLALDVSLTKVPESSKLSPSVHNALSIVSLASLGWHDTRVDALKRTRPSPSRKNKHSLEPDETMLCYDNLYYVGAAREFEWESTWAPSWNLVGQHASYNPVVENLAREYIFRAFEMDPRDTMPPYIGVHVRRTDFAGTCGDRPRELCFPPLSAYAAMVDEVKTEIMETHGINIYSVLLTSDERNQSWWDEAHGMGWKRLDHVNEQTEKLYGPWYPVILDTVALSLGKGFVGTKASTLSLLASKRVQLWSNGAVRSVGLRGD